MSLMRKFWLVVREVVMDGLLHGWPGRSCPDCGVRPLRPHKDGCKTAEWDGGIWA